MPPDRVQAELAFSAFLRRLAETQARAMAGDMKAGVIMDEYGLNCWLGCAPQKAFEQAEGEVARAWQEIWQ